MNRRTLLKSLGWSLPALGALPPENDTVSVDFTPVDLTRYFDGSPAEVEGLPTGRQRLYGIPFLLGPDGGRAVLTGETRLEIPIGRTAHFLCFAQFCDRDPNENHPAGIDVYEKVGQKLAEAVLVFEEGGEARFPIRRRFEVNAPSVVFGHHSFNCVPHRLPAAGQLFAPLSDGGMWGFEQTLISDGMQSPLLWIWALANPQPEHPIRSLRLEAASPDRLMLCGLTLFHRAGHPLRHNRLALYRFTLPEDYTAADRWTVAVDLGVVARTYVLPEFDGPRWLEAPGIGLGEQSRPAASARYLYAEVSASDAATLTLRDNRGGALYSFPLKGLETGQEIAADSSRIVLLEREKTWIRGQVVDAATGRPTPVRLAFRSREGRYIPPYGHRTEVNYTWFQDYGADLKLMDTSFAYVDGEFQVELPVGEVYLEMTKGFEYEPVRRKLDIQPGQRELRLEAARHTDLRAKGWVTADTHVHFLSPSTALLESQAEGLNLINLLAAQWGQLFTNFGDLPNGELLSKDGQSMVRVGTENRQHIMGHIGLLGGHGHGEFPLSAAGPGEAFIGDPLWCSLADWADDCGRREGLAVAMHFPYPTAELAADIVLGKIDAVEIYPRDGIFDTLRCNDWYRYLNCGYRLPAVGGTDKMGAYMPAGANRTYAWLGDESFTFRNWAEAVRRGNTFATTGPLLLFEADGHRPGEEVALGAAGGSVEVRVEAFGGLPFHRVELVWNGRVIASREEAHGTRRLAFSERVKIPGPGWLAARCASRLGPTTTWAMGIAAHTSPVYFKVRGQELFSPPAAAYFLTLIDGTETWVRNLATRAPDPAVQARILRTLAQAREQLHRRLHA